MRITASSLPLFCRIACVATAATLLASSLSAQQSRPPDRTAGSGSPIETRHLTVTTSAAAAPRGRVTLVVDIVPKPKMHVYAPEQKDVIPVALQIEAHEAVRPGATKFPKPEKYFFAPLKETQFVYSKPFRLTHDVVVTRAASTTPEVTITGTLRYQACDDAVCYLPQNVALSWKLPGLPGVPVLP